ncbi:60S ribosomal protein L32 [Theileria orientalis]|uniref:60S ribosomal protein L32 n=2 Tax=Theileria orientalis TaxID=68886 RepID=J7MCC6_THEOR|nr:60S ribosomal protein L32 [Theileria orientalis strain Shintoku]PVC50518.1 60S ribosomal protein L32 [Theileria orientalis]UKJ89416.1 60S ribosomal protein L32 [Theileria orientalis]UKK02425.2 60S ribosomal protein L32 [Theileria orientalis]BAM42427.1 60S ribosomal protein L32 [Theileria orientalis strain Shintoku]|eukprot:XP_009692728.1 60S ribosomal protein L32 [Theileria orientalis strain Shintoku]
MAVKKVGDLVHKRTKKFRRFHSDRFKRIRTTWRKPKGIDNRVRRRFRSVVLTPKVGYGTNKRTRHQHPGGVYKVVVSTPSEVDALLMSNKKYVAEVAHNVSAKKRRVLLDRADKLGVRVTNRSARLKVEEKE